MAESKNEAKGNPEPKSVSVQTCGCQEWVFPGENPDVRWALPVEEMEEALIVLHPDETHAHTFCSAHLFLRDSLIEATERGSRATKEETKDLIREYLDLFILDREREMKQEEWREEIRRERKKYLGEDPRPDPERDPEVRREARRREKEMEKTIQSTGVHTIYVRPSDRVGLFHIDPYAWKWYNDHSRMRDQITDHLSASRVIRIWTIDQVWLEVISEYLSRRRFPHQV